MKINNPVATQPNFTAKVKNNDFMQSYVKESGKNRLNDLKESLSALKNVYPEDTLEITQNKQGGFDVENKSKNTSSRFTPERELTYMMDYTLDQTMPLSLPKLIKNIATKGTKEHNQVFNVKEQPAEAPAKTSKNEKSNSKEQKEVFDMLA